MESNLKVKFNITGQKKNRIGAGKAERRRGAAAENRLKNARDDVAENAINDAAKNARDHSAENARDDAAGNAAVCDPADEAEDEAAEAKKSQRRGTICCILGAVSWGFSGTCSEALFRGYAPDASWITAVRMTAAGVLMMAWLLLRQRAVVSQMIRDGKTRFQIAAFAIAGLLFCQLAYLCAIQWTNSGTATVLQNISVLLIAIFVCITTRKLPDRRQVISIVLALLGVWMLATGGKPGNLELSVPGLLWGLAAAVGAASYSLLSRAPVARWGSLPVTGMGLFAGGVVFFAAVRAWHIPAGLDAGAFVLLALIVLVGTVGAFTLFLQGIRLVGPVKAILLGCLEPLTAAFLSAVWIGSSFSAADYIGFVCILATVLILR